MAIENQFLNFLNLDIFDIFYNFVWEDLLVIFFLYSFLKYVILCSINELIWPTHFFNRKHSNSYTKNRFRTYVEYINKFYQNEDLKYELLETEGTTIVESSPYDKIWGVGLRKSDERVLKRQTWQGLNLLGEILTEIRDEIIQKERTR